MSEELFTQMTINENEDKIMRLEYYYGDCMNDYGTICEYLGCCNGEYIKEFSEKEWNRYCDKF